MCELFDKYVKQVRRRIELDQDAKTAKLSMAIGVKQLAHQHHSPVRF